MWTDPIVEETRRAREQYTVKFNYDLEAIYRDLKDQERQSGRDVVSLLPKPPRGTVAAVRRFLTEAGVEP